MNDTLIEAHDIVLSVRKKLKNARINTVELGNDLDSALGKIRNILGDDFDPDPNSDESWEELANGVRNSND